MFALLVARTMAPARLFSTSSSASSSTSSSPSSSFLRRVLVLNAGSSSLKLKLFEEAKQDEQLVPVASALVERLGTERSTLRSWRKGEGGGTGEGQKMSAASPVSARDVRSALSAALPHLGLFFFSFFFFFFFLLLLLLLLSSSVDSCRQQDRARRRALRVPIMERRRDA